MGAKKESALAAALVAPAVVQKGPPCGVERVLRLLDRDDPKAAASLRTALAMDPGEMPGSVIRRRLVDGGYRISGDALRRHRRGDCRCPR